MEVPKREVPRGWIWTAAETCTQAVATSDSLTHCTRPVIEPHLQNSWASHCSRILGPLHGQKLLHLHDFIFLTKHSRQDNLNRVCAVMFYNFSGNKKFLSIFEVPIVVQQKQIRLTSMRFQVLSLTSLSVGQGSGIAMSSGIGRQLQVHFDLGTSMCRGCDSK